MGLVNETIPNLINGISQQPDSVRRKTQCEKQINGLSSVVNGLQKRPPTEHKELLGGVVGNTFIHTIRRDENEWYTLVVVPSNSNDPVFIADKEGVSQNVVISQADKSYLTSVTDPLKELGATTVADYTFIVNKSKKVLASSTNTIVRNPEALVYVRQGDYSTDYKLVIQDVDGTVVGRARYTTPDSSTVVHEPHIQTDQITTQLYNDLTAPNSADPWSTVLPSHFSVGINNNVLHIIRNDGSDFKIGASDSKGSQFFFAFKDQIEDYKKLPAVDIPIGFYIKVSGTNEKLEDDYWLKSVDGGAGQPLWEESVEGGISDGFDASTMPHQLIRMPDGYFCFCKASGEYYDYSTHTLSSTKPSHSQFVEVGSWAKRLAGDNDSNPLPSLENFTISDVFFYKNRLGFLSDENVIFSESAKYFNLFRTTVMSLLDGDPIDIAVSNNKVSLLRHAIPFSDQLMLFSALSQFSLKSDGNLTSKTVSIDAVTQYEASLDAKPTSVGKSIFFATQQGSWSGIREYVVDSVTDEKDAEEITAHTPNYLKGKITHLTSSSSLSMLVALCDGSPSTLFIYNYYKSGSDKLQSAWSEWKFDGIVRSAEFSGSDLWVIIERNEESFLEKINISTDLSEDDTEYTGDGKTFKFGVKLDRRVRLSTASGVTTLPYVDPDAIYVTSKGKQVLESEVSSLLSSGEVIYAGVPYLFTYEFSRPAVKQDNEKVTGRLQLRSFKLLYSNSGYFKTIVEPLNREPSIKEFTGKILDKSSVVLGHAPIDSGEFKFPVLCNAENVKISIESISYLPCELQSAVWEGYFKTHSHRI